MPSFDIIITSWNRLDYLKRTIASLIRCGTFNKATRVIIVDNGSQEEGLKLFLLDLQKMPNVFLVLKPENRGWGAAVNDALGLSRSEFLFVSNNDVDYFTPDFQDRMFEVFQNQPNIGILGVWRHIGHGFVNGGAQNEWFREMDNVPAVGWMMPKRAMEMVGMLPEHGPCLTKGGNGEDTAYVNRMKEKGFFTGVLKEDIARHIDGY